MEQIPWNMPAILVRPGNHPNFTGLLSDCMRYWRDDLSPVEQRDAMIAIGGGRWLEPYELILMSRTMPARRQDPLNAGGTQRK